MTRELGVRFAAEGVRINAVAPGLVYSPLTENVVGDLEADAEMRRLHPMGRSGKPEMFAAVVAFLASDGASLVTAGVWPVHGGTQRRRLDSYRIRTGQRIANSN